MTSHLPECVCYNKVHAHWCALCICARLRACEHRVEETWSAIAGRDQYAEGYRAALNAAREAIVALEPRLNVEKYKGGYDCCGCSTTYDLMGDALAAIDALREKP